MYICDSFILWLMRNTVSTNPCKTDCSTMPHYLCNFDTGPHCVAPYSLIIISFTRTCAERLISRWALSVSQRQLHHTTLCFRADSLCSGHVWLWTCGCSFTTAYFLISTEMVSVLFGCGKNISTVDETEQGWPLAFIHCTSTFRLWQTFFFPLFQSCPQTQNNTTTTPKARWTLLHCCSLPWCCFQHSSALYLAFPPEDILATPPMVATMTPTHPMEAIMTPTPPMEATRTIMDPDTALDTALPRAATLSNTSVKAAVTQATLAATNNPATHTRRSPSVTIHDPSVADATKWPGTTEWTETTKWTNERTETTKQTESGTWKLKNKISSLETYQMMFCVL